MRIKFLVISDKCFHNVRNIKFMKNWMKKVWKVSIYVYAMLCGPSKRETDKRSTNDNKMIPFIQEEL